MTYHERPGVYSAYDTEAVYASGTGRRVIALVGVSAAETGLYSFSSWPEARTVMGESCQLGKMLKLAYQNGAQTVLACPAAEDSLSAYTAAVALALAEKKAAFLALGSQRQDVLTMAAGKLIAAAGERNECIGIASLSGKTDSEAADLAEAVNSERMILLGTGVTEDGLTEAASGLAAAALAGVLSDQSDPAAPLHGAVLEGLCGVESIYTDAGIDTLVQSGVSVLEAVSGAVTVVRAVTTRTSTLNVPDASWREVTTMLILDDVIPSVRRSLKAKFLRCKNTSVTRNAIRSQVIVELQDRVDRQIIESFEGLRVQPLISDPSVCEVSFTFAVVHGLSRILLTAHVQI